MSEPAIHLVMRLTDLRVPIGGSELALCSRCLESVWLDPTVSEMARSVGYRPVLVCTRCVDLDEIEPGHERTIVEMVKQTFKD